MMLPSTCKVNSQPSLQALRDLTEVSRVCAVVEHNAFMIIQLLFHCIGRAIVTLMFIGEKTMA